MFYFHGCNITHLLFCNNKLVVQGEPDVRMLRAELNLYPQTISFGNRNDFSKILRLCFPVYLSCNNHLAAFFDNSLEFFQFLVLQIKKNLIIVLITGLLGNNLKLHLRLGRNYIGPFFLHARLCDIMYNQRAVSWPHIRLAVCILR